MTRMVSSVDTAHPWPAGFLPPPVHVRGVEMLFGTKGQSYPAKTDPNPDAHIAALTEVMGPIALLRQTTATEWCAWPAAGCGAKPMPW